MLLRQNLLLKGISVRSRGIVKHKVSIEPRFTIESKIKDPLVIQAAVIGPVGLRDKRTCPQRLGR